MSEEGFNNGNSSNATSVLSSILSNPAAFSKMSEIIAKHTNASNRDISPQDVQIQSNIEVSETISEDSSVSSKELSPTLKEESSNESSENSSNILSIFSSLGNNNSSKNDKQTALLLAVRPYLSKRRQELLDTMLGLEKIGKIFMENR